MKIECRIVSLGCLLVLTAVGCGGGDETGEDAGADRPGAYGKQQFVGQWVCEWIKPVVSRWRLRADGTLLTEKYYDPPPVGDIVDVTPDPRNTPVDKVWIVFTEPVRGLDRRDLTLRRGGRDNLLTANQTVAPEKNADRTVWALTGLSKLTQEEGKYTLALTAAESGVIDDGNNPLAGDLSESWIVSRSAVPVGPTSPKLPSPSSGPDARPLRRVFHSHFKRMLPLYDQASGTWRLEEGKLVISSVLPGGDPFTTRFAIERLTPSEMVLASGGRAGKPVVMTFVRTRPGTKSATGPGDN